MQSLVLTSATLLLSSSSVDACINAPNNKCPIWPRQFQAPFGLHSGFPSEIKNASSTFYYKFLENGTQAQLVDYKEHCFPFVNAHSIFEKTPCKLYFEPRGIFLSQPGHNIPCCTFVQHVGAVPPTFLQAYTYKGIMFLCYFSFVLCFLQVFFFSKCCLLLEVLSSSSPHIVPFVLCSNKNLSFLLLHVFYYCYYFFCFFFLFPIFYSFLKGTNKMAPDYYGNQVSCDYWEGLLDNYFFLFFFFVLCFLQVFFFFSKCCLLLLHHVPFVLCSDKNLSFFFY